MNVLKGWILVLYLTLHEFLQSKARAEMFTMECRAAEIGGTTAASV